MKYFLQQGFTPCKAKQPLKGMESLQEKDEKDKKHIGRLIKECKDKMCLIEGATKWYFTHYCGHYFIQYGYIQVFIFYRFFWKASFLSSCAFRVFYLFCVEFDVNLHKLHNICIINVFVVGVRCSVLLFSFVRIIL